jgi:hypothetical protein
VRVAADWFACDSGKYAITLSRHYPSLRTIGRHQVSQLEVRPYGSGTAALRRLQYIGLRLDVLVPAQEPSRYVLLAAESTSRRWHLGRLSVGSKPWPWFAEKSLAGVKLEGPIELVGPRDRALLQLSAGRVERVAVQCGVPPAG